MTTVRDKCSKKIFSITLFPGYFWLVVCWIFDFVHLSFFPSFQFCLKGLDWREGRKEEACGLHLKVEDFFCSCSVNVVLIWENDWACKQPRPEVLRVIAAFGIQLCQYFSVGQRVLRFVPVWSIFLPRITQ